MTGIGRTVAGSLLFGVGLFLMASGTAAASQRRTTIAVYAPRGLDG